MALVESIGQETRGFLCLPLLAPPASFYSSRSPRTILLLGRTAGVRPGLAHRHRRWGLE